MTPQNPDVPAVAPPVQPTRKERFRMRLSMLKGKLREKRRRFHFLQRLINLELWMTIHEPCLLCGTMLDIRHNEVPRYRNEERKTTVYICKWDKAEFHRRYNVRKSR